MPWRGIERFVEAVDAMKVRVNHSTYEGVMRGGRAIQEQARVNTGIIFRLWTGRLSDSITVDDAIQTSKGWGVDIYPQGGDSYPGTPYGRIQELGGTMFAHNSSGFMWWEGLRSDGTFGLIRAREVTLPPRPYLEPAVQEMKPVLEQIMMDAWEEALFG